MISIKRVEESTAYHDSIRRAMTEVGRFWANHGHRRIYFIADKLNELAGVTLDAGAKHYYDLNTEKFCIDGNDKDIEKIIVALEHRAKALFVNWPLNKFEVEELGTTIEELRDLWNMKEYILNLPSSPKYHTISLGEVFLFNGILLKKISSKYIPDNIDAYDDADGAISRVFEHYHIEAIDISDTPEGQQFLAEHQAKLEKARHIEEIKKNIREAGTPITLIDGKPVEQPEGTVLFDAFNIYGTGERLIETETEYWYLINNGMDGDNWARNTVITGGAGAYGWKLAK